MTLANIDQALRIEWEKVVKELGGSVGMDELALEFGRRVVKMMEAKEDLARAVSKQ